ncbi:MAG: ATP-dependent helicase [Salinivirgaceae bacterium]|nr:ATP-dependent helicase [Salinivirgaceae bacterium]
MDTNKLHIPQINSSNKPHTLSINNDPFAGLNPSQREAVTAIDGRIRVAAGAGSGKTKTLASRFAFLVNTVGIDAANILCVTFTNKAAQEMRSRIARYVNSGHLNDMICTLSSLCVKILRQDIFRMGYPKSFTILDDEDQKALAKEVLEQCGRKKDKVSIRNFLDEMEVLKSMDNCAYIERYMLPNCELNEQEMADPHYLFMHKQLKLLALDFTDIDYFALYLLHKYNDVCNFWQDKINYMMVDEAQDCNGCNWDLIETIGKKHNNIFVVGDPDQAIYEWRGSKPELFLNFNYDLDLKLEENYRSTQDILNIANSLICHNQNRIKKDLFAHNKSQSYDIVHYHGDSEVDEAQWVVNQIKAGIEKANAKPSDFAILYRASYMSRSVEQELMKLQLPYIIWGGTRFFDRKEIKDALSYLRLVATEDDLSFLRVINLPSRKLGKVFVAKVKAIAERDNCSYFQALKNNLETDELCKINAIDFVNKIEEYQALASKLSISDLLDHILLNTGYKQMLREDKDDERLENLEELMSSIKLYEQDHKEDDVTLNSYLQDIALYTNLDRSTANQSCIKLMTIHQSKGLEFPFVFVVGLSEGMFPSLKSVQERKQAGLEEERRLMFVAVTRAEKCLFLTESEGYNLSNKSKKYPSRFLTEINRELFVTEGKMDQSLWQSTLNLVAAGFNNVAPASDGFEVGDKVWHAYFGNGEILEIVNTDSYRVLFAGNKERFIRNGLQRQ